MSQRGVPHDHKKLGGQTAALACPLSLLSFANVVGKKEGEGPLAACFDYVDTDDAFGASTWEQSERAMQQKALTLALEKAGPGEGQLDWLFAGDLLNQCISSSFAARDQKCPFFGLYGACSTMGEGLALAAMTLDGGFGQRAGVVVSSHFWHRGAAVPHPAGVWQPAHSHRPMDCDRRRSRPPVPGGSRPLPHPCHPGQGGGQGGHRHQQHGSGHGPRRL